MLFNQTTKQHTAKFVMRKMLKIWIACIDNFLTYKYFEYNHAFTFSF